MSIKERLNQVKAFIDVWKIWLFFLALFGTNAMQAGVQEYVRSEPTSDKPVKTVSTPTKPQKTIIIHKADNEYCDRKLKEHETGSQH